jgi:hypothetical protein
LVLPQAVAQAAAVERAALQARVHKLLSLVAVVAQAERHIASVQATRGALINNAAAYAQAEVAVARAERMLAAARTQLDLLQRSMPRGVEWDASGRITRVPADGEAPHAGPASGEEATNGAGPGGRGAGASGEPAPGQLAFVGSGMAGGTHLHRLSNGAGSHRNGAAGAAAAGPWVPVRVVSNGSDSSATAMLPADAVNGVSHLCNGKPPR